MRKVIYFFTTLLFSTVIFASEGLGIVSDEDFLKVGVTPENIEKAKLMVNRVSTNYKMLVLEKKQLELEVNKYVLENPEANLEKIDILFDKIGAIEAMENELKKLGVQISSDESNIYIKGNSKYISCNEVFGHKDHRIVMSLAIFATLLDSPLIIEGAEAISKSYPNFFEDLKNLNIKIEITD